MQRRSTLAQLTIHLTSLYRRCDHTYVYVATDTEKGRLLTKNSDGVANRGYDNKEGNFIFRVGDIIAATDSLGNFVGRQYRIESFLGSGSFGQVLQCVDIETYQSFAVKVIKNLPAYTKQAAVEHRVLKDLLIADPEDEMHMIRLVDQFHFHGHFCFVTDILGIDLYSVLKQKDYRGFSLNLISKIMKQILETLCVTKEIGLIHSDLKPENILVDHCLPNVRVIDFGSSAYEGHTIFSYVQSRYYRSPEVILQLPYTTNIDMWSVGCITAELFIGHPLFPGCTEHDQLNRITSMLGPIPTEMVRRGKNTPKFYVTDYSKRGNYHLCSTEEFQARTGDRRQPKVYSYVQSTLEKTIEYHQIKFSKDRQSRVKEPDFLSYFQFIRKCLEYDPSKRLTPQQALQHPFIQQTQYIEDWIPPPYTSHPPYHPHPNGIQRERFPPVSPTSTLASSSIHRSLPSCSQSLDGLLFDLDNKGKRPSQPDKDHFSPSTMFEKTLKSSIVIDPNDEDCNCNGPGKTKKCCSVIDAIRSLLVRTTPDAPYAIVDLSLWESTQINEECNVSGGTFNFSPAESRKRSPHTITRSDRGCFLSYTRQPWAPGLIQFFDCTISFLGESMLPFVSLYLSGASFTRITFHAENHMPKICTGPLEQLYYDDCQFISLTGSPDITCLFAPARTAPTSQRYDLIVENTTLTSVSAYSHLIQARANRAIAFHSNNISGCSTQGTLLSLDDCASVDIDSCIISGCSSSSSVASILSVTSHNFLTFSFASSNISYPFRSVAPLLSIDASKCDKGSSFQIRDLAFSNIHSSISTYTELRMNDITADKEMFKLLFDYHEPVASTPTSARFKISSTVSTSFLDVFSPKSSPTITSSSSESATRHPYCGSADTPCSTIQGAHDRLNMSNRIIFVKNSGLFEPESKLSDVSVLPIANSVQLLFSSSSTNLPQDLVFVTTINSVEISGAQLSTDFRTLTTPTLFLCQSGQLSLTRSTFTQTCVTDRAFRVSTGHIILDLVSVLKLPSSLPFMTLSEAGSVSLRQLDLDLSSFSSQLVQYSTQSSSLSSSESNGHTSGMSSFHIGASSFTGFCPPGSPIFSINYCALEVFGSTFVFHSADPQAPIRNSELGRIVCQSCVGLFTSSSFSVSQESTLAIADSSISFLMCVFKRQSFESPIPFIRSSNSSILLSSATTHWADKSYWIETDNESIVTIEKNGKTTSDPIPLFQPIVISASHNSTLVDIHGQNLFDFGLSFKIARLNELSSTKANCTSSAFCSSLQFHNLSYATCEIPVCLTRFDLTIQPVLSASSYEFPVSSLIRAPTQPPSYTVPIVTLTFVSLALSVALIVAILLFVHLHFSTMKSIRLSILTESTLNTASIIASIGGTHCLAQSMIGEVSCESYKLLLRRTCLEEMSPSETLLYQLFPLSNVSISLQALYITHLFSEVRKPFYPNTDYHIGLIGCGTVGSLLLRTLLDYSGLSPLRFFVSTPHPEKCQDNLISPKTFVSNPKLTSAQRRPTVSGFGDVPPISPTIPGKIQRRGNKDDGSEQLDKLELYPDIGLDRDFIPPLDTDTLFVDPTGIGPPIVNDHTTHIHSTAGFRQLHATTEIDATTPRTPKSGKSQQAGMSVPTQKPSNNLFDDDSLPTSSPRTDSTADIHPLFFSTKPEVSDMPPLSTDRTDDVQKANQQFQKMRESAHIVSAGGTDLTTSLRGKDRVIDDHFMDFGGLSYFDLVDKEMEKGKGTHPTQSPEAEQKIKDLTRRHFPPKPKLEIEPFVEPPSSLPAHLSAALAIPSKGSSIGIPSKSQSPKKAAEQKPFELDLAMSFDDTHIMLSPRSSPNTPQNINRNTISQSEFDPLGSPRSDDFLSSPSPPLSSHRRVQFGESSGEQNPHSQDQSAAAWAESVMKTKRKAHLPVICCCCAGMTLQRQRNLLKHVTPFVVQTSVDTSALSSILTDPNETMPESVADKNLIRLTVPHSKSYNSTYLNFSSLPDHTLTASSTSLANSTSNLTRTSSTKSNTRSKASNRPRSPQPSDAVINEPKISTSSFFCAMLETTQLLTWQLLSMRVHTAKERQTERQVFQAWVQVQEPLLELLSGKAATSSTAKLIKTSEFLKSRIQSKDPPVPIMPSNKLHDRFEAEYIRYVQQALLK
ncbi:putative serine/threonine protein kinase [Blattamonas nauphoetae]|uniref:Serine/threonine protein kinase n=1 Tax=Blattamonas nauphoetae TaxID=2049346 RepID=A0ABQ9Y9E8_9EUKA|nr:putative serine/threonine protein kinase [Blattamonas nauphoetae]